MADASIIYHPVAVSAWQILIGNIVRQITDRGELVEGGGGRRTVIEDGGGAMPRGHLASA